MTDMLAAIARATRDLFVPRMLVIVLLPMLGAIALWVTLAWVFWDAWTGAIAGAAGSTAVAGWLTGWGAAWVIDSAAVVLVVIAILPATYVTAIILTELFAMPAIIRFVGARHFSGLRREGGGTLTGSLLNATAGIAVFALLWIITLPLWLTGVGAIAAPVLTSAYLAQRVFRYDALAEHASATELPQIIRAARGDLFLLAMLLSLLLYVPVVNLFVPALSALAFTHYCLARLARGRAMR